MRQNPFSDEELAARLAEFRAAWTADSPEVLTRTPIGPTIK